MIFKFIKIVNKWVSWGFFVKYFDEYDFILYVRKKFIVRKYIYG